MPLPVRVIGLNLSVAPLEVIVKEPVAETTVGAVTGVLAQMAPAKSVPTSESAGASAKTWEYNVGHAMTDEYVTRSDHRDWTKLLPLLEVIVRVQDVSTLNLREE